MPGLLVLVYVALVILGLTWVYLAPGPWLSAAIVMPIFLIILYINTQLHLRYERTSQAVRIPRRNVVIRFRNGLPGPMLVVNVAFFVIVAIMLVFGVAPVTEPIARLGITACVLALFALALVKVVMEIRYVKTGRATELDLSEQSSGQGSDQ